MLCRDVTIITFKIHKQPNGVNIECFHMLNHKAISFRCTEYRSFDGYKICTMHEAYKQSVACQRALTKDTEGIIIMDEKSQCHSYDCKYLKRKLSGLVRKKKKIMNELFYHE